MKLWLASIAAASVAVIAMSEAIGDPPAGEPAAVRGDPRVGEALAQRWCNECHLVGGARSGTDAAPTFQSISHDPAKSVDHLRAFLASPHAPMPPIPLSGTEVEDLISYIRSLGP